MGIGPALFLTHKDRNMNRTNMGEKRRCLSCNTAFFDLNRTKIACPKCNAAFQVIEPVRSSARSAGAFNGRPKWPSPSLNISTVSEPRELLNENATPQIVAPEIEGGEYPEPAETKNNL
jgi:hypothetical protein